MSSWLCSEWRAILRGQREGWLSFIPNGPPDFSVQIRTASRRLAAQSLLISQADLCLGLSDASLLIGFSARPRKLPSEAFRQLPARVAGRVAFGRPIW